MPSQHINLNRIVHDCRWFLHRYVVLVYEKYPTLKSLRLAFKPAIDSSLLTVY